MEFTLNHKPANLGVKILQFRVTELISLNSLAIEHRRHALDRLAFPVCNQIRVNAALRSQLRYRPLPRIASKASLALYPAKNHLRLVIVDRPPHRANYLSRLSQIRGLALKMGPYF